MSAHAGSHTHGVPETRDLRESSCVALGSKGRGRGSRRRKLEVLPGKSISNTRVWPTNSRYINYLY